MGARALNYVYSYISIRTALGVGKPNYFNCTAVKHFNSCVYGQYIKKKHKSSQILNTGSLKTEDMERARTRGGSEMKGVEG